MGRRIAAASIVLAVVAAGCALTVESESGVAVAPATTSAVTTSPVTTSQDSSPITTSPVTTSQDPSPVTTSPVTTSPPTTTPAELDLPAQLEGWDTTTIRIGDRSLVVVIADTLEKRRQGLMLVSDLRDLDGMLFVFETPRAGTFWMKDTLIPLDIAWFDESGSLVGATTMIPCVTDACERYGPGVDYLYAVETAEGGLDFVTDTTKLSTNLL